MKLKNPGLRMGLVCFAAASAGLSVALISIAKVLLVVLLLALLLGGRRSDQDLASLRGMWTPRVVVALIFVFACSLFWTSAPLQQALGALGKYGKFLVIPALLLMTRTRAEAALALACFLGTQVFLLMSSWLLYAHLPLPWATSNTAKIYYAVFSSYLDQSIMGAVMAAVFWHLRELAPSRRLRQLAVAAALLALGSVFVVFIGRTGQLVGLAMVALAVFWALPGRYRLASLLIPPLMFLLAYSASDKVAQRFATTKAELSAYTVKPEAVSSLGVRLSFWHTSAELIAEKPLTGFGIGSWATEFNRLERSRNTAQGNLHVGSNPHQEFLLWGVQLGAGGIVLLLVFLGAALRDFRTLDGPVARAGQSVLAGLAISCLFNSTLYDAYIGDFFCLSLGVLLAYGWWRRHGATGPVAYASVA